MVERTGKRKLSTAAIVSLDEPPSYEGLNGVSSSTNTSAPSSVVTPEVVIASKEIKHRDKDLVSAAEALTQLTQLQGVPSAAVVPVSVSGTPKLSTPPIVSNGSNINSPLSALSIQNEKQILPPIKPQLQQLPQHPLVVGVNKVSRHPLVTNAVKYYDYSKRTYAPFNYAAGIVEKAAMPVVNKIEVNLNNRYQAKQARRKGGNSNNKKRKLDAPITSTFSHSSGNTNGSNVSMETKKRLQFCLHILRLANDKINNLVHNLQQKVTAKEKRDAQAPINSEEAQRTNTEIVTTVKNIIRLISNFKPSSLSTKDESRSASPQPETKINGSGSVNDSDIGKDEVDDDTQLKGTIRDIILSLPATVQQNTSTSQSNDRVLVFAKESLDMILRLTTVFNIQLEKAEAWVSGEQQLQENEKERADAEAETEAETEAEVEEVEEVEVEQDEEEESEENKNKNNDNNKETKYKVESPEGSEGSTSSDGEVSFGCR